MAGTRKARRLSLPLALLVIVCAWSPAARAQYPGRLSEADPRGVLQNVIMAMQLCGPPQVYQLLGQQLFQIVAIQTNNMGCYPQLRPLGAVTHIEEVQRVDYPVGPVISFEVTFQFGRLYWQFGVSRLTEKVEWLNFSGQQVDIPRPPTQAADTGERPQTTPPKDVAPPPGGAAATRPAAASSIPRCAGRHPDDHPP